MDRSITPLDHRTILTADFLQLDPGEVPPGGLSDWLTGQLRQAISDGRLPAGTRLPASRVLAGELRVSRGVVTEAYRRLAEGGQTAASGRAGTRVLGLGVSAPHDVGPPPTKGPEKERVFPATADASVFDLIRGAEGRIDLSPGLPDLAAFPRAAWLRAERTVLGQLSPPDFGYGDPRGAPAFRTAVADWLARNRGIRVDPGEVTVVAGVAQALALLACVLRQSGLTEVAVEDPGSVGARLQLGSWGLATPPVPVDDLGLRVADLRASGARAVMLTPAHQFPMGVVLDGTRRRELGAWARDGGLVIEDDYDAEHRYDRPPVPALRSALPEQVCYTGSVSKLLAPALRVGWLLAPAAYRGALVAAKRDSDLGNAALPQLVLAELMRSGELERHHRLLRRRHISHRDAMIGAVRQHLPQARVHGAAAGLHLTLTFGGSLSDVEIAAAALECGVKIQPLSWHSQLGCPPGLVLGYAASTTAAIEEGIEILGRILRGRRRRVTARDRRQRAC